MWLNCWLLICSQGRRVTLGTSGCHGGSLIVASFLPSCICGPFGADFEQVSEISSHFFSGESLPFWAVLFLLYINGTFRTKSEILILYSSKISDTTCRFQLWYPVHLYMDEIRKLLHFLRMNFRLPFAFMYMRTIQDRFWTGLRNFFWKSGAMCMRTIRSEIGNPLNKNHKNQPAFLLIYGHKRPVFVLFG